MAKFHGFLETPFGGFAINEEFDYFNRAAMVVDTLMNMGTHLFDLAEECFRCGSFTQAEEDAKTACKIMNMLFAWKEIPAKRPPECATSWLDDAWCTLHAKYEELKEKEVL